ncbi:hypothetical protein A3H85_03255 [Candidatus Daviesbacteria bacterium RIFCSPLOWO2_02_FULL_40_8]|uniref:tRNA-guanine(15) transglycosylase-like domain-containing protein n=1 Tax=Candidatus Daviesbacteria bacterium RIFCSPLOWO2_01_FULL_40_24 TaxID=1797787 RepID=A0A1F5MJ08_9BACT|nr:MAG: hypothetical protein A2780_00190 [Candidatus Daviesbacteria bacterium RIFCSPHIGHO2_01_FULL_41_45]OGE34442.1 MAG: hypothetical protein A3C32_03790 [Candidatus Daviesbacteria bacterium RIFCSPHIGHO2_02_FULL_41_14]OGE65354.1 MAG: hypothetical protein A3B49_00485 [Candidatus Daviesbacteria bacterium RIFCSPLOWO2_01_FULL_40_24]OGE66785.1 MAG: hypothetical protein A3H85_03255 [Candidatus Daviesbacteria bacterium RIFCSPLOWO2_02_FULL_40_8]
MGYLKTTTIRGNDYNFPIYLPDATRAVARSLDSEDLKKSKIEGVVVNTYHLMSEPGTPILETVGGVKKFMNWDGLVVSDSGGFQVFSLIYQDPKFGKISDAEVTFYKSSKGEKRKYHFTPERSIQVQFVLGSDIIICLDDVPSVNAKEDQVRLSVKRTIEWAKRCKEEFAKQLQSRKMDHKNRPLLLAVIQGGDFLHLREECAQELIKIGFDAFGYGGFPMDEQGNFRTETLKFVAGLMPDDKPKFALGVGTPQDIVEGFKMGYNIFDCVLPTRDARHQRLSVLSKDPKTLDVLHEPVFNYLNMNREKFVKDSGPISEYCDCFTCQNYSRAYLHHLFKIEEFTAGRLASIHNLRTYTKIIELLRATLA